MSWTHHFSQDFHKAFPLLYYSFHASTKLTAFDPQCLCRSVRQASSRKAHLLVIGSKAQLRSNFTGNSLWGWIPVKEIPPSEGFRQCKWWYSFDGLRWTTSSVPEYWTAYAHTYTLWRVKAKNVTIRNEFFLHVKKPLTYILVQRVELINTTPNSLLVLIDTYTRIAGCFLSIDHSLISALM